MTDHKTEQQFVDGFNMKKFGELGNREKEFIVLLNDNTILPDNCMIKAYDKTKSVQPSQQYVKMFTKKNLQKPKRDVVIEIDNKIKKISLKSGTANSFHQEIWHKFQTRLKFLHASADEIEAFHNFIHSRDRSYFTDHGIECPQHGFSIKAPDFCDNHSKQKKLMQRFLDKNAKSLLEHIIKKGYCSEEGWAEFIFHGEKNNILSNFKFGKIDLIINDILTSSKKSHADLHLGQLTFQRWNTCPKDKSKLNSIQLKGGTIKDFLK